MKRYSENPGIWIFGFVVAVALVIASRVYQCRNANDRLACWLSDRIVTVVNEP